MKAFFCKYSSAVDQSIGRTELKSEIIRLRPLFFPFHLATRNKRWHKRVLQKSSLQSQKQSLW